jgi:hypothetical protein
MSLTAHDIAKLDMQRDERNAQHYSPEQRQQVAQQRQLTNMFINAILTNAKREI